ncbi:MAG: ATP-binding protein [Nanoarchaeota archaeon]
MDTKEVEEYLTNFQKKDLPTLIHRPVQKFSEKKINAIIGPRRAGKTSFLFQIMRDMISQGRSKTNIIYLNFENARLFDIQFKEVSKVIEMHKRLFPSTRKPVIFIDEPQNVVMWEKAIRDLYDDGFQIFISGSSSKLLSKEIATPLRGRSLSVLLLPFSFAEFLSAKGYKVESNQSSDEMIKTLSLLDEYLEFGGYPEVVLEKDNDLKQKTLENYLDLTIYKDMVERHGIKDTLLVKWLIKSIMSSYTKEISINKIYSTLKSQGRKFSKDELYTLASMISDSFFAIYLPRFSYSIRKREPTGKAYLCDIGFARLIESSIDVGKKMENTIFLELTRRQEIGVELFYWKTQSEEVDFVLKRGTKVIQLIQVSKQGKDEKPKDREARALLKARKALDCQNLLIITQDEETTKEYEWYGIKENIKSIPLWKWLLQTEKIL